MPVDREVIRKRESKKYSADTQNGADTKNEAVKSGTTTREIEAARLTREFNADTALPL